MRFLLDIKQPQVAIYVGAWDEKNSDKTDNEKYLRRNLRRCMELKIKYV